jgi:hypothetical protein
VDFDVLGEGEKRKEERKGGGIDMLFATCP